MAQVNLFEWDGSYAISGSITPALPDNKDGVVTIRAVGVDERITFQAAPGDEVNQIDSETTDIIINVPGGSDHFLIPVDISDTIEEEGDLAVNLSIISFEVGGGSVPTSISTDAALEVTIVDDEVTADFTIGQLPSVLDYDNPATLDLLLSRFTSEDIVIATTVVTSNGLGLDDISVPATVTIPGNATGAGSLSAVLDMTVLSPYAQGTATITVQVQSGNAVGLYTFNVAVTATQEPTTYTAQFFSSAPLLRQEWLGGNAGMNVVFNQSIPTAATLTLTCSPAPDVRLKNTATGEQLLSTFTVSVPANRSSVELPVSIIDAPGDQGDATYVFTITDFSPNSTGAFTAELGSLTTKTLTILDDETPAVTVLTSPEDGNILGEGDDAVFTVTLSRGVSQDITVQLSKTGGDAVEGIDFDWAGDRVTVPAYATQATGGQIIVLSNAFPSRTLEVAGNVIAGGALSLPTDDTVTFTTNGDGNPVEVQFDGITGDATEGGAFDLTFVADVALPEELALTVKFPEDRFPGLAAEGYEQEIIMPAGVTTYTWTGIIPDTDTTTTSELETWTLLSVAPTVTNNISTPALGAQVTADIFVTDNDIPANLGFTVAAVQADAGDTVSLEIRGDRTVPQDTTINLTYGGAIAADLAGPATALIRAGSDRVAFDVVIAGGSSGGAATVDGAVDAGSTAFASFAGTSQVSFNVGGAPITNSFVTLDNAGTISFDVNEWDGGTYTFNGTVDPVMPVGGDVTLCCVPYDIGGGNSFSDPRVTFTHGLQTSTITIPIGAGQASFSYELHVSGDTTDNSTQPNIAPGGLSTKRLFKVGIYDANSTSHAATIPTQGNANYDYITINDDDVATGMDWDIDTTSVFVDDTTGHDITVTINLDHAVSADAEFGFIRTWREAFVGGEVTLPVITVPAHATTATGTITVEPGTYQDFNLTLSAGEIAGNDLVVLDGADQVARTVVCPDEPVDPGVAQGAPSQIVHRVPGQSYLATRNATGPLQFATGQFDLLLQTVVPIDPVVPTALPFFTIDGNHADVFPVSYDHDGKVRTVQVVGPADTSYVFESVDLALTANSIAGSGILEQVTSPGSPTQTLTEVNLSELDLSLWLDDGSQAVEVKTKKITNWDLVETVRSGAYIKEEHRFAQFDIYPAGYTAPTGYSPKVLGVHAWITQRSDVNVAEITFKIANDVFDDTIGDRGADHPEVNGEVWFYGIKVNSPAGFGCFEGSQWTNNGGNVDIIPTDPSIDSVNGWLVRPLNSANPDAVQTSVTRGNTILQPLPKQARLYRKTVIGRLNNQGRALAVYLNRFGGYGISYPLAFDGDKPLGNNYQAKRGYGSQQDYLPSIDSANAAARDDVEVAWYAQFGSGREVFRARTTGTLRIMRSACRMESQYEGPEEGGLVAGLGWEAYSYGKIFDDETDRRKYNSWFRPYMHKTIQQGGGKGIVPRVGYGQCPEDIELGWMQLQYVSHRARTSMTNLQGKVVEPEQIAKVTGDFHNAGVPILPWQLDTWRGAAKAGNHPWFWGPLKDSNLNPTTKASMTNGHEVNPPLAPTNRFWNAPAAGLPTTYAHVDQSVGATERSKMKIMFSDGYTTSVDQFMSTDGEHHWRFTFMTQAPIWFGNMGPVKHYMQQDAAFVRHCHSQYDTMGDYVHQGTTYQQKGRDAYKRLNLKYLADNGTHRINSSVGSQHTNRAQGEPLDSIGMAFSVLGDETKRAKLKSEWLPTLVDATKAVIFPLGISRSNDGLQSYANDGSLGASQWDSTWQELCYLESGLSGVQDILDLDDANFLLEEGRRRGAGNLTVGTGGGYLTHTQAITSYIYFAHGIFGCAVAFEGVEPGNLGNLGNAILTTTAYLPLRQWQWTDRRRELMSPDLSAWSNTDTEFWRAIDDNNREFYCPQTGLITGAGGVNGTFKPAMDFVPWSWPNSTVTSWFVTGHRPIRDALHQGIAYRMTGDRRFLLWGAQQMFDQWTNCDWDASWNPLTQNDNYVECDHINAGTYTSLVPTTPANAARLWQWGAAQDYYSITQNSTIEPPTMVDPMGAHMAGWAGECIHLDWNLTYDPKRPPNYDEVKATPHGAAYFAEATGAGGGVGFPETTKKTTGVIADFILSGGVMEDLVSGLSVVDSGQGVVTVNEVDGVKFLTLADGMLTIPTADADQIRDAIVAAGNNAVTIEAWVRSHDITNEGPARIMSWTDAATPTGARNVSLTQSKWGNATDYHGALGMQTGTVGKYAAPTAPQHYLKQDKLHHIVLSIEGLNASGWVNTFCDGGSVINQHVSNTDAPLVRQLGRQPQDWVAGAEITIGDEKQPASQATARQFDGDFYRLSFYDDVFSAQDVYDNFYAGPDADLGVTTVTQPARARWTNTAVVENEDADNKIITLEGSYTKPLASSTTLTVSANIPAAETRLTAVGFTGNTKDITLAAGETDFSIELLMTSATGDQGTQVSRFYLTADSGTDSVVSDTSACVVQLIDGHVPDNTGGTGGGGGGNGGTGSQVTEITTDSGVTWYFDRQVEAGQFVTGDWWVVGPVNVIDIFPRPTNDPNMGYIHGSMINPATPTTQGELTGHERTDSTDDDFTVDVSAMTFDSNVVQPYRTQGYVNYEIQYTSGRIPYDHSLNAGFPNGQQVSQSNPITLAVGDTLNSSWTHQEGPYWPGSTEMAEVYMDGQLVRSDYELGKAPWQQSAKTILGSSDRSTNLLIEPLTVLEEAPAGYNSGGSNTGGGSGGGGISTVYREAMLPSRLGTWYTPKTKWIKDVNGNNQGLNVWQDLNSIGVKMALRWKNHSKQTPPYDPPYTAGEYQSMLDDGMEFIGVRSFGLSSDDPDRPSSFNKLHGDAVTGTPLEDGTPVSYRWVGFAHDDWPIPYTGVDADGDTVEPKYWMLGHEPELAGVGISPWDLNTDGTRKWTMWDGEATYNTGDKVFMIDRQSDYTDPYETMYGRMQVFRAIQNVPAGTSPLWQVAPGYSNQYIPADNAYWVRDTGDTNVDWGHGPGAYAIAQAARDFKAAYPEQKLYYFYSKGVCVAGWNGVDGRLRPGWTDPEFGLYEDQLSYFSAIASIPEIDGFLFDYYPFNSKPTGRSGADNDDPPSVYTNPVSNGTYIVDDPKWVVSGVHRIKDWSTSDDFPEGKPVYVTLAATPNFVSGLASDTNNPDPTAGGLMAYYHWDRPTVQEQKDLVLSCVNAGADGFIWYNHTWKCVPLDAATAPWTPADVKIISAGPVADFWPYAYKNYFNNDNSPILDKDGNPTNLHGKYFPDIPNVNLSGDGTWEMMTEVSQYILQLLPELEDEEFGGAITPPVVDSPPVTGATGYFRPSVHLARAGNEAQKVPTYHTSSVDAWLDAGKFANLPLTLQNNMYTFDYDTFMTPYPMGYTTDGVTGVPNPEDYYYLLPDGRKYQYRYAGGISRVTSNNMAATDYFYVIGQRFGAKRQGSNYGGVGGVMSLVDDVMVALNSDIPREHKRALLIWFMQYAIDLDALYRNGQKWLPNGDHSNGRYTPILLKRLIFDEEIDSLNPKHFSENRQISRINDIDEANFYVCQSENPAADATTSGECRTYQIGFDVGQYTPTDGLEAAGNGSDNIQGMPFEDDHALVTQWTQWGWPPYRGDTTRGLTADVQNPKYMVQTSKQRYGIAIGWRAMNMMDKYRFNEFFDHTDKAALLIQDYPYVDNAVAKRSPKVLPWLGTDSTPGQTRMANALLYDLWRPLVGYDYDLSSDTHNYISNAESGRGSVTPVTPYANLSEALGVTFPEPPAPGGTGGPSQGEVGSNPFYPGIGSEGNGELYPPAIDDSVTNPDAVINGANTGHRTSLGDMTVSSVPTTGDACFTFARQGDCAGYTDCIEVPPEGMIVSAVVFSSVDSYQNNRLIQIDNDMNYDLSFVDCLFIGQTHFFQRYSDNGGTVKTADLGKSTQNGGCKYTISKAQAASSDSIDNLHILWSSFRGTASKIISAPVRTLKRVNFDWYTADAVNMMPVGTYGAGQEPYHFEECWWGDSSHVRGMASCNPTDSPWLFDCSEQSTYNGYDVENCKPLHYTQCGQFAYGWSWPEGDEVHCDSYQIVSTQFEEFRLTKCTFAINPSLWNPKNDPAWNYRWVLNTAARYSPLWHDDETHLSAMTVDGYPAPPVSTSATILERMQDKNLQVNGITAKMKKIIFDRCNFMGAGSSYHSVHNGKYQIRDGLWSINGCPDPSTPLYPGGGNDPAGSPGYEQYDTRYYNVTRCTQNVGYNVNWGTLYNDGPTEWHFSSCTFGNANKSAMWQLHSDQNLSIPHEVVLDIDPQAISTAQSTSVLSSCDELRAAGYTDANGWTGMDACEDNFDSKQIFTDGNNKFIDIETGQTCQNIRMNDGTNVYGTINPAFSIEDFIAGNPVVGNNVSVINVLNREQKGDEDDYTIYQDTFYHPDRTSGVTGTNVFPAYLRKPYTSRDRCQCED